MTTGPRLQVVSMDVLADDAAMVSAWRGLASDLPTASYFQTPDWALSWWQTLGRRAPGEVALVWEDERLLGCFALIEGREPLTRRLPLTVSVSTNVGSGIGTDHAAWLAQPEAAPTIVGWVASHGPTLLRGIPVELGEAIGGRILEVQRCPRLMLAEAEERISSKLAKNLRNARRRLEREGVTFRWEGPGAVEPGDLEELYRLHHLRRSATGDRPIFDDPVRRQFHEALRGQADSTGGNAMILASRDDRVVGALYGFVWQDTFAYYQIGWDPAFRQLSLGSVLVLEAIEETGRQDLSVFDFLRGADDYKYRFGATDVIEASFAVGRSPGLLAITVAHGARSRLRRRAG